VLVLLQVSKCLINQTHKQKTEVSQAAILAHYEASIKIAASSTIAILQLFETLKDGWVSKLPQQFQRAKTSFETKIYTLKSAQAKEQETAPQEVNPMQPHQDKNLQIELCSGKSLARKHHTRSKPNATCCNFITQPGDPRHEELSIGMMITLSFYHLDHGRRLETLSKVSSYA